LRLYNGVTPETVNSSFYFWTPANGYKPEDEQATELLYKEIAATFVEDVEFLEAQDRCMSATRDQPLIDIKHDVARLPARRAVERMMEEERQVPAAAR